MNTLTRITFDANVMGGKPCIRGMRITVGTIVGLIASGGTTDEILKEYPYLEAEDIIEVLAYVARHQDRSHPFFPRNNELVGSRLVQSFFGPTVTRVRILPLRS